MRRLTTLALASGALAAAAAAPADAATSFVFRGAGFGHGVGMSQYGALGQAKAGRTYQQILAHYYTGTSLGRLDRNVDVRVLLQTRANVAFAGATQAGDLPLDAARTYSAVVRGSGVELRDGDGRAIGTTTGPLRIGSSAGPLRLVGGENAGAYRGSLVLAPSGGALNAVNHVGLEDYVKGVVSSESPASWPTEALRAQAVAARTYAITTSKNGGAFDHYADTRSQVYDGVAAERTTTDAAVRDTAGQVVIAGGKPVVTYFFSTSGGRTENAEFGFPGGASASHLKSVSDPWDKVSPYHRWGPTTLTPAQAGAKLGGLVKGSFRGIEVTQRGRSQRIVKAVVVGSAGRTEVSGPTLRLRFGLRDTWATFATIDTVASTGADEVIAEPARAAGSTGVARSVRGTIVGVKRGTVVRVQRRSGGTFRTETRTQVGEGGRYRAAVTEAGAYRVVVSALPGPTVTLR